MGRAWRLRRCEHDAKADKDSGRMNSRRLHRGDQNSEDAPFHRSVGPPGGRFAAWRAWSPQGSKYTSDGKKRREEVPRMDTS